MDKSTISARIDTDILTKLDGLSKATARSKSYLIAQAIGNYVEDQAWQIEAIKEGVKQADEGKFASDRKVKKALAKWGISED